MSRALAVVALILVSSAAPAAAQSELTEFTAEAYARFQSCSDLEDAGPPAAAIAQCQADITSITALQDANQNALAWEKDFTWTMRAGIQMALGGAYGGTDGVRSARVCEQTERWWSDLGQITPGSQFDTRGNVDDAAVVRQCRNEFGTPAWGRAVP